MSNLAIFLGDRRALYACNIDGVDCNMRANEGSISPHSMGSVSSSSIWEAKPVGMEDELSSYFV